MSKDSIQQRMAAWMADYEDRGLLQETMEPNEVDADLLNTAFDIMKECYPKFVTNGFIKEFCRLNPHLFSKELKNG